MKRNLLAAMRLAALYAAGVLLLAIPFGLLDSGFSNLMATLTGSPILAGFVFAIGFLLLAVARRIGFAILWLLLLAYWGIFARGWLGTDLVLSMFNGWSISLSRSTC